ncbi:MAG TPA: IPTL-CTERM sorting domain-containing protein [Thermoanaerobaculia bacterium]|nr:IPTL-CTERM sorting domain-containing protein [Thermoanaerobaculia bacterium]
MVKLHRVLLVLFLLLPLSAFAQSADQEVVSVVDSPDPVTPGATLTYTVTVRNNGPDAAVNGGVNINLPGAVTHTTDVAPAGWSCNWLGNSGTCSTPSFPAGTTEVITVNATVGSHLAASPDQAIQANFSRSGTTTDPLPGNDTKSATTQVDSPQVDVSVGATDSPDPVGVDGNVTYSVTVSNAGPDTANSVNFNVVPHSSLRFVSSNQPAGWSCTFPAVGAINATFTCSRATWAPGSDNFTIVFSANDEQFGINDTAFQTNFNVNSGSNETDHTDNSVTLTTAYVTPDADVTVTVTDAPDPVAPDGNITYTVTVGNNGPDAAPNITLNSFGGNNLRFVSASVPAGWNCTLPAANAQTAGWTCTLPAGLAVGASSVLTFVLQAAQDFNGVNDGTILFGFSANSTIADPVAANNSETESTGYSTADADIHVAVTDSPDPVSADGNITYTVTVGNNGPDTAPSITLNSFGGNNLRFQSATVPAGWNCTLPSAGTQTTSLTCTLPGGMVSGDSDVFTFVMQADDALLGVADGTILFGFSANSTIADPVPANNSETESTAYDNPNADLGVGASDSPDPASPANNLITYTGGVSSAGPDTASDVTLTIPLAAGLLFQSLNGPAGFACTTPAVGANGTITCTDASVEFGANVPFTLVVQVDPALYCGPDALFQQQFLIGSPTNDPNAANNTVTVNTSFDTRSSDLSVTNTDTPDPVLTGGTITYTQTITNNGPDDSAQTTFLQSVPAGTTFQQIIAEPSWLCVTPTTGGTGMISCARPGMVAGSTNVFTLIVNVTAPTGTTIVSTVTADDCADDPNTTNNTSSTSTTVGTVTSADLSIAKTTAATNVAAGSTFTYTITVSNAGPDAATNVTMQDNLPAGLVFESLTVPAGFICGSVPAPGATGLIDCQAATLASGASAVFTLTVRATGTSGTVVNNATVSSLTSDPDSGNATGNAPGVVLGPASADVSIVKVTPATNAPTGSTLTYTITVSNAGPSPATGVVVTDTLPAGLQLISATPSQGTCNAVNPISCNIGTLNNGANATVTIQALVTATSGTITNTASVTAAEGDADGGDNASSTPPIPVGPAAEGAAIPTLSEWMLMLLAAMLGIVAVVKMRS